MSKCFVVLAGFVEKGNGKFLGQRFRETKPIDIPLASGELAIHNTAKYEIEKISKFSV